MTHELKTWPEYFSAIERGEKTFEFRKEDRGFAVGDLLTLQEYEPNLVRPSMTTPTLPLGYTGRNMARRVTYILPIMFRGADGEYSKHVIMAITDKI